MWARSFRRARSRKSSRSTANSSRITQSTRRFGQMNSRHANDRINDGDAGHADVGKHSAAVERWVVKGGPHLPWSRGGSSLLRSTPKNFRVDRTYGTGLYDRPVTVT